MKSASPKSGRSLGAGRPPQAAAEGTRGPQDGPGRPAPPDEHSSTEREQRERKILDAAVSLLLRWGYRKTTVDDVAREAGVGKGTIYLHWKDKNEMFLAALWRASREAIVAMLEELKNDSEGGEFHRFFAHGMVAVFANPLLAAIMSGKSDIFRGLIGSIDPATINRLVGTTFDQVARMQEAGLIRSDVSVHTVAFLLGALKTGIVSASEYTAPAQTPSTSELTDALGELIRRWLEPENKTGNGEAGRRIIEEWMNEIMRIGTVNHPTEE